VSDTTHGDLSGALDDFVAREVEPVAARTDQHDEFPTNALRGLGAAGYLASALPEPYGGGDGLLPLALSVERIAMVSPSLAWAVVVHVSAAMAIASTGTREQQERRLPRLVTGEDLASFAFTETGAGADFFAIESVARAADDGYEVKGAKAFISLADQADLFVTLTSAEREGERVGPTMLVVERTAPGFSTGSRMRGMGMRGIGWGELLFDQCRVPAADRLGEEGKGIRVVYGMAGPYLVGAAALGAGIAAGAYEAARTHLRERSVKGSPIGDHEALQFRLADLSAKVEAARALVYRACADTDPRSFLPFQAKLFATETALDVTRSAVQLGGASSYVEGSRIERLARDAYAATLHFENNDFLRSFVGRTLVQA
jgi:alkylation response protein AidB-like acyl-CoA dehydrogenase